MYVKRLIYGTRAIEKLFFDKYYKNIICIFVVLNNTKYKNILTQACVHNITVNFINKNIFIEYFSAKNLNENIVAIIKSYCDFLNFKNIVEITQKSIFLIFDNIKDTQNLGACLRTAYLFGVSAVFLTKRNACRLTLGVYKISSGFFGSVPVFYVDNLNYVFCFFKKNNISCIGFTHRSSTSLTSLIVKKPVALFFGSEDFGLVKKNFYCYDDLACIKMVYSGPLDNLNLSVSVGIVLFELTRTYF